MTTLLALAHALTAEASLGAVVVAADSVWRVDDSGLQPLASCSIDVHTQRGHEVQPCSMGSLVVHPISGRYAFGVTAQVFKEERLTREHPDGITVVTGGTTAMTFGDQRLETPRDARGGLLDGTFLVVGDATSRARPILLEGLPDSWASDGPVTLQSPLAFTDDGQGLLVRQNVGGSRVKLWTLDLRGEPRWISELGGQVFSSITVTDGGRSLALQRRDGSLAFAPIPASPAARVPAPTAPALRAGHVALAKAGETIVAVVPGDRYAPLDHPDRDGTLWRYAPGEPPRVWRGGFAHGFGERIEAIHESGAILRETRGSATVRVAQRSDADAGLELPWFDAQVAWISPSARHIAILDGELQIHDLGTGQIVLRSALPEERTHQRVLVGTFGAR